jgi:hypothetical protein
MMTEVNATAKGGDMNLLEKILLYPLFLYMFLSFWPGFLLALTQREPKFLVMLLVQEVSAVTDYLGWLTGWIPCLLHAWKATLQTVWAADAPPNLRNRTIDRWTFPPLNWLYANPRDGVSGQDALVQDASGTYTLYMVNSSAAWRAYCWSFGRNRSNMLVYYFRWENGPWWQWQGKKYHAIAGWRNGLLACSVGRGPV